MTGLRGITAKFAIFALIAGLLGALLLNTMLNRVNGGTESYSADFSDVSGLRVGDDVRVAGVRVGRVTKIEVTGEGAEVTFQVRTNQPILSTTRMVMRYQNLLGQRYLALVQSGERGPAIKAGARIPVTRTSPGFDLTELLNGFRPLFETLKPSDVNALAASMVKVLQGEGGTIESLLEQTASLTTTIASRDEVFDEVLTNLTPVLKTFAGQGEELHSTVVELRALMEGLARDRTSIGSSIDGMSQLIGSTSEMLREVREPATVTVPKFRQVLELFAANEKPFVGSVQTFEKALSALGRAGSYESALNIYVCSAALALGSASFNFNLSDNGPWSAVCAS